MPPDELAARRRGIKAGAWALIPSGSGKQPIVRYVVSVGPRSAVLDVPVDGARWQRVQASVASLTWCEPSWTSAGPGNGEAA